MKAPRLFDPGPPIPVPLVEHPEERSQGWVTRQATPDEGDNGCELGIAYDPVGGWPA